MAATCPARTPKERPRSALEMPTYRPLVTVLVFFLSGVGIQRMLHLRPGWWMLGLAAMLALWTTYRRRKPRASSLLLSAAILSAGGARLAVWEGFSLDDVGRWASLSGAPVLLEGRIVSSPTPEHMADQLLKASISDSLLRPQVSWLMDVQRIRDGSCWLPASGRLRVRAETWPDHCRRGDLVRIGGRLLRPPGPGNPGQWDRRQQLLDQRITSELRLRGQVEVVQRRPSNALTATSDAVARCVGMLRLEALRVFHRWLPNTEASLAAALVLGERSSLDEDLRQGFRNAGVVHVLAVSGMHVSMVLLGVWMMLRLAGAGPWIAFVVVTATAIAYALLAGSAPPVWRAAVLAILAAGARVAGRRLCWWNALAAAGLLLLAVRPTHAFDVGVQLSFLAVAALLQSPPPSRGPINADPLERHIERTGPWPRRWWSAARRAGLAALQCSWWVWLATTPLVLSRFHLLAPWSIVLSPLLWAPIATALLSSLALLLVSSWLWPLNWLAATICRGSLKLVVSLIGWTEGRDVAWSMTGPPAWWISLWTLQVTAACLGPPRARRLARRMLALSAGIGAALIFATPTATSNLRCTVLSVGHGSAAVIEAPGGGVMVCDAGCMAAPFQALDAISQYLWSRGLSYIDPLVVSHADSDHLNAAADLMSRFRVKRLVVPPSLMTSPSVAVREMLSVARRRGVAIQQAHRGTRWNVGQASVIVEHPPPRPVSGGDNANSLVLLVQWSGRSILLPGDLEGPGLEMMLKSPRPRVDLLLAAHHGSPRSLPAEFASWCRPDRVVISSGSSDSTEVARKFFGAGASVWHTQLDGAVLCRLSPQAVDIQGWRTRPW